MICVQQQLSTLAMRCCSCCWGLLGPYTHSAPGKHSHRKRQRASASYPSQGSATAGVVDDLRHHTLDVVVALSGIEDAELSSALAVGVVGLEDGPTTLTLRPNNTTHLQPIYPQGKLF